MSEASSIDLREPAGASARACWRVRLAGAGDLAGVVAAVAELLGELGATAPDGEGMRDAARALLADERAGAVLVAEAGGALVGVLVASWQTAIHVPGRYGLIQDLWVRPDWRGVSVGGAMVRALCELAGERGIARIEVGLPRAGFPALAATEAFYRANGFAALGPRMRWLSR